jgi:conjugal transfer/entry exclusion protein
MSDEAKIMEMLDRIVIQLEDLMDETEKVRIKVGRIEDYLKKIIPKPLIK